LAVAFCCAGLLPAHAVPLPPDQFTPLPGTSLAQAPSLAGQLLAQETVLAAFPIGSLSQIVNVTVEASVIRSVAGTLDFYWRVLVAPDSVGWVQSLSVTDFAAAFDADWRSDSPGAVAPSGAWHFPGSPGAPVVQFSFSDASRFGLAAGEQSHSLLLRTQATHYSHTGTFDLSGLFFDDNGPAVGGTGPLSTFAPAVVVPEPAAWALWLGGLAALPLLAARRRAQSGRRMRKCITRCTPVPEGLHTSDLPAT
jgi:hypothetical protein